MAAALPFITAIASIASVGSSIFGGSQTKDAYDDTAQAQRDAADAQDRAAYESEMVADQNARNQEAETLENVRREDLNLEQELGDQRARAAASGLSLEDEGDSLGLGIAANRKEGQTQIDWMEAAGMNKADIMRWEGDIARDSALSDATYTRNLADISNDKGNTAMWSGAFSGVTNAASAAKDVYSAGQSVNWWA